MFIIKQLKLYEIFNKLNLFYIYKDMMIRSKNNIKFLLIKMQIIILIKQNIYSNKNNKKFYLIMIN